MTDSQKADVERTRLRYNHVESLVALGLIGVITLGGFVLIFHGNSYGQTIVASVISLIVGRASVKRSIKS
jgi:hypothetical protein